eukprot:scpid75349/ scgid1103/ Omega-amidase NIT2-A; Nitrilase homolog 2
MTAPPAQCTNDGTLLQMAIVHDAFFGDSAETRLLSCLREARARGASLAVLSELPLNSWMAVSKEFDVSNAEVINDGHRQACLSRCAREAGIALIGGAITYSRDVDASHVDVSHCDSTSWLFDSQGVAHAQYAKVHLPQEAGYWEASHYSPSANLPVAFDFSPAVDSPCWKIGVQLCSDIMRPAGAAYLASQNVQLLLHPRATPLSSYEKRWKPVLRAAALTGAAYVVSVNRPSTGQLDTPCGGASLVVSPQGEVILETTDPLTVVTLDLSKVEAAKEDYPGYLQHAEQLMPPGRV